MADKQKNRGFLSFIGSFFLLQLIFIIFEGTAWIPNMRYIDGKLFGRIAETAIFSEWFNFYETPHFNVFTVFFGIVLLVPGIIGAIKDIFSRKSVSN
ncbi:YfzA family protein [Lysinibacillus sp. NPDC093190]|uniref:YfzA family protein n=1 Tax=Lysinibacillus sp. NPDC093190 TaxID=3390575 RepID=UPI003D00AD91